MQLGIQGLTAIVTGGSKGIGRFIVLALLAEGVNVSYCSRSATGQEFESEKISTEAGVSKAGLAFGSAVDISKEEEVKKWVEKTVEKFGGVDIVVSNVSALDFPDTLPSWRATFETDLLAYVNLVSLTTPYLLKSKNASIVSIGSASGHEIDFTTPGPYGPIKAALAHYSQSLAVNLASKGIRVNTVSPGNVYFKGGVWEQIESSNPEFFKKAFDMNPMGRMAKPEEVANTVVFLASAKASGFTSGANIALDGALTKGVRV